MRNWTRSFEKMRAQRRDNRGVDSMDHTVTPSGSGQQPGGTPLRRPRLRGWIFPAITLGLFLLLGMAAYRANQPQFGWDLAVSHAVQGLSWPGLDSLLRVVCLADNDLRQAFFLVAGVGLVFAIFRAWREAAILIGVVVVGQGLCALSGELVGRPRPSTQLIELRIDPKEIEGFPSFPSGHVVHYTVFFGFLWFLALTRVKPAALHWLLVILLGGLVVLVGPARIYLGAHWLSDVVGGYLLGGAVLATGVNLYGRWCGSRGDRELSDLRDGAAAPS
jgi:membrane-associated phospholipid phosphatase